MKKFLGLLMLAGLVLRAASAHTTATATTTTLTVTSGGSPVTSVASGASVTLTATVTTGATKVNPGKVEFCNAAATHCTDINLLATAQLTSAGTATYKFIPGSGVHSYKAIFIGASFNSPSVSSAASLTVTPSEPVATTTAISQSGSAGNYTLTATVTGSGPLSPTGTISFLDTSASNAVLGMANLTASTASASFSAAPTLTGFTHPQAIAAADFDGDGIPDMAIADVSSSTVTTFKGNGDGTFTQLATVATDTGPDAIVAADFNGDGILDLALTDNNRNYVTILEGNGDGTFTKLTTPQAGFLPIALAAADFNLDGIEDLAVVNEDANNLTILKGNGDGTFTAVSSSPTTGSLPKAVAVADFNGDGIPDLAVANSAGTTLTILQGKADGTFTALASPAAGSSPAALAVADFDGDGHVDIAVANEFYGELTILKGNGDGTFTKVSNPPTDYGPTSIAVADFNGDGIPDLVVGNQAAGDLTILQGNGDGTFTPVATPAAGMVTIWAAVADFNGDGIPDISVANLYGATTDVFLTARTSTATATATGISPAGSGTHNVDASYPGDTNYKASISTTTGLTAVQALTVTAAKITVQAGATPIQYVAQLMDSYNAPGLTGVQLEALFSNLEIGFTVSGPGFSQNIPLSSYGTYYGGNLLAEVPASAPIGTFTLTPYLTGIGASQFNFTPVAGTLTISTSPTTQPLSITAANLTVLAGATPTKTVAQLMSSFSASGLTATQFAAKFTNLEVGFTVSVDGGSYNIPLLSYGTYYGANKLQEVPAGAPSGTFTLTPYLTGPEAKQFSFSGTPGSLKIVTP